MFRMQAVRHACLVSIDESGQDVLITMLSEDLKGRTVDAP